MSWHYLQELEGEFSVESYLAGIRWQRWKLNATRGSCCCNGRGTEFCRPSPFGTTSAPLTETHGGGLLTLSPEASPVKTLAPQGRGQEFPDPAPDCGLKCTESFAKYDLAMRSWRTPQCSLLADLDEYSETWPKSGIMLHGACWELPTAAPPTTENASGFSLGMLPTPIAHNAQEMGCPSDQRRKSPGLGTMAATGQLGTPGALNPTWVEALMGWPINWTTTNT